MSENPTNPTGTSSAETKPTEPKNLMTRVTEKIDQTVWNYVIWSLPDLAPLEVTAKGDAALAEKEKPATEEAEVSKEEQLRKLLEMKPALILKPENIPTTNYLDVKKDELKDYLVLKDELKDYLVLGKNNRRYSFSFGLSYRAEDDDQKGTLARITQNINQYPKTVEGTKVRTLINDAFGYAVFDQRDLFDGNLHEHTEYNSESLNTIIETLEKEFEEEADVIPEEIKYLKKILADNNFGRQGKTRISIDPYVIAMTSDYPDARTRETEGKQKEENVYRKIIIGALLGQEDKIAKEDEASEEATEEKLEENTAWNKVHDEWNSREKTYFTADEAKLLIPRITMKEMAMAAKELNFEKSAYNALLHYKGLRNQYTKMLTTEDYYPNKPKPEEPAVITEPEGNGNGNGTEGDGSFGGGGLGWMDNDNVVPEDDE